MEGEPEKRKPGTAAGLTIACMRRWDAIEVLGSAVQGAQRRRAPAQGRRIHGRLPAHCRGPSGAAAECRGAHARPPPHSTFTSRGRDPRHAWLILSLWLYVTVSLSTCRNTLSCTCCCPGILVALATASWQGMDREGDPWNAKQNQSHLRA